MKRYTHGPFIAAVAITLALAAYFFLSSRTPGAGGAGEPVRYRSFEAGSLPAGEDEPEAKAPRLSSAIPLEPDETLLDLYSLNMDFDDEEEQILVTRRSGDASGAIRVVLADYSPSSRRWTRAWEGQTLSTQVKTFQVSGVDLIGDHNFDIVCTGMNADNEQTMTVFWKSDPDDGRSGLRFIKVFEQSADAVLVEDGERSESYKMGQTNAESWPITVWRPDPDSSNFLDQIKETWTWSFTAKAYLMTDRERIPGASIAKKLADSILDGKADTFERWLEGIWYQEGLDPLAPGTLFLTFQPRDGTVLFSSEGVVENFRWESSSPTRMGIYVSCRNQSVSNLRRLLDVELETAESIDVRVFQDLRMKADVSGRWDGRYRRLSPEAAKAFRKVPSAASVSGLSLDGLFLAPGGEELRFDGSLYTMKSAEGLEEGSFAVYTLAGKTLLDMRAIKAGDQPSSRRRSWFLSLSVRSEDGGTPVTVLSLAPARVGMDGAERLESAPLVLEKRLEDQ